MTDGQKKKIRLVHCYGTGGSGWTIYVRRTLLVTPSVCVCVARVLVVVPHTAYCRRFLRFVRALSIHFASCISLPVLCCFVFFFSSSRVFYPRSLSKRRVLRKRRHNWSCSNYCCLPLGSECMYLSIYLYM